MKLVSRFFQIPDQSCFLLGPRGTGKSTWLRDRLPDALYLDLLDPALHRRLDARPERLRELLAGSPRKDTVVIDEIQRIPELLSVVHAVLEEPSPPRFVLTGSSARKLRRGGVDLLGGRAVHRTMHPFMAAELPKFDLDRALRIGLLPLVMGASDPSDVLDAYASLYLNQEVRAEGLTRNISGFTRFLEAISFSHGARSSTSRRWQENARSSAWSSPGTSAFSRICCSPSGCPSSAGAPSGRPWSTRRSTSSTPACSVRFAPKGRSTAPRRWTARRWKGLVAQHLRAWAAYSRHDADLHFWRTRAGTEVDFVVYGESGLQAFEVKNARKVHSADLRSLRTFRDDYPEAETASALPRLRALARRRHLVPSDPGLPSSDCAGPRSAGLAMTNHTSPRRKWLGQLWATNPHVVPEVPTMVSNRVGEVRYAPAKPSSVAKP